MCFNACMLAVNVIQVKKNVIQVKKNAVFYSFLWYRILEFTIGFHSSSDELKWILDNIAYMLLVNAGLSIMSFNLKWFV